MRVENDADAIAELELSGFPKGVGAPGRRVYDRYVSHIVENEARGKDYLNGERT